MMCERFPALTQEEGQALVRVARAAIRDRLLKDGSLERALKSCLSTSALEAPRGVFVTLRRRFPGAQGRGALRGCVGTLESQEALPRATASCAVAAAFEDPRFPPLTPAELEDVMLEVSVLTPRRPLASVEEIELGRDGVALERGPHRAVFLPQVALEQGWNRQQLLEQLALKAGLPSDGWREATLHVFRGQVFEESR